MATPRSLKGNLLSARDRLGESIISIVAQDVAEHGPEVVAALRKQNPAAYARLVSDLVAFRKLKTERAPPKRKPRPLRMKALLEALSARPVDPDNPQLPPKHLECWLAATEKLKPRQPFELSPGELRRAVGSDLARWYERQVREPAADRCAHHDGQNGVQGPPGGRVPDGCRGRSAAR
jgi:hypothetical protein